MTNFELDYGNFQCLPQIHQLSTIFHSAIEELFETLETADVDMSTAYFIIELIFNWNFGNKLHYHNGTNQRQHIRKNTSQQYQPRTYQIPRTSSIIYLK